MKNTKKIAFWKYILSVIALWFLTLVGGSIIINLWNVLSPAMCRYERGDLGYYILQIISGPFGVYLGNLLFEKLFEEEANTFCMINNIVLASVLLGLAFFVLMGGAMTLIGIFQWVTSIVCAVVYAVAWSRKRDDEIKKSENAPSNEH